VYLVPFGRWRRGHPAGPQRQSGAACTSRGDNRSNTVCGGFGRISKKNIYIFFSQDPPRVGSPATVLYRQSYKHPPNRDRGETPLQPHSPVRGCRGSRLEAAHRCVIVAPGSMTPPLPFPRPRGVRPAALFAVLVTLYCRPDTPPSRPGRGDATAPALLITAGPSARSPPLTTAS